MWVWQEQTRGSMTSAIELCEVKHFCCINVCIRSSLAWLSSNRIRYDISNDFRMSTFFWLNNVHFLWEAISPAIRLKWADLLSGRQGGEYILPPLGFCTAFLYLSNKLDWQQNNIWILDLWPTEFSILSAASGVLRGFPLFLKSRERLVHDSASTEQHQGFKAGL